MVKFVRVDSIVSRASHSCHGHSPEHASRAVKNDYDSWYGPLPVILFG